MSEKLLSTVVAALVGGIFGAVTVFFFSGQTKFDNLEVGNLTITGQATLLDKTGKEDVVLKEGSVLANNVILSKKFIGTQYQGHVFVGNRMFTSPDDLVATPMEQWRFFTEIGSSPEMGGEMIVRSPNGANVVGQPVNNGVMLRTGFDKDDSPQMFALVNQNGMRLPVPFLRPGPAQQPGAAAGESAPTAQAASSQEKVNGTPAVAADPAAPKAQ